MALVKDITLPSQIALSDGYYRIFGAFVYFPITREKILEIKVECFKSQEARLANASPILELERSYRVTLTDEEYQSGLDIREIGYAKLKELPEFEEAEDA